MRFMWTVTLFAVALAETLWPIPISMHFEGSPIPISRNFSVNSHSDSNLLHQAINRYLQIFKNSFHSIHAGANSFEEENRRFLDRSRDQVLQSLEVSTVNEEERLNSNTSYEYWINVQNMKASVVGQSVFGAIYGLETFSQLMVNGSLLHSTVTVHDKPNYHHRGLMIDTGRRFFPMSLVYNLLDAMSYLKMNVLHFHLSDYCRFAVESVKFPQLTASLNGQYYKQDDIRAILEYARERGIRVVPEFDLPGHSKGLAPLAEDGYLNFCSDNHREIYGDPQNKSLETLQTLLAEMATLFPESLFDIGCDETAEVGLCTITNIKTLEQQLFDFIYSRLGKVPTAYEEALFKSKSAKSNVVIQAWESYRAFEVVRQGNKAIEGNGGHFYLSHSTVPLSAVWTDIAYNMTAAGKKLLLGGEISFWTDEYCPNFQCWNETNSHHRNMPVASWMWDSAHDSIFSQSVGNMIWPRGIAAAGAFWNFNSSLSTSSMDFLTRYHAQNQRLIERGVISCPSNCTCDTLSKCGKLYPHAVLVNDTK